MDSAVRRASCVLRSSVHEASAGIQSAGAIRHKTQPACSICNAFQGLCYNNQITPIFHRRHGFENPETTKKTAQKA
ncbi:hypothetical protein I6G66_19130 [Delftia acidovorans]|uniref:Uncharacterized protein n=1 Tax=Delftia acidovorans TaxID=80866 RepID=A0A7T2S091_DELAC|nr:hypothetical protein [Delftia acidovorans]QPS06422.1 hypothetical protein I6G66_19130 [Delftia acidovorans]